MVLDYVDCEWIPGRYRHWFCNSVGVNAAFSV